MIFPISSHHAAIRDGSSSIMQHRFSVQNSTALSVCMISEEPKLMQHLSLAVLLYAVKIERPWVT